MPKQEQQKLIDFYFKKLGKGLDTAYNPKLEFYDGDLAHSLKTNILEFSAFKEASFRNSLLELLTEKGKLPTWSEFRKQALATSRLYNVNWLATEFNQTVATANMARKWQEFQDTKDLYPNLQYVTAGDERVRDKHKKWDGFIAPIDHPIWQKLYPPNDWGCRCDVIPTDEDPTKGYETFTAPIKGEFANNGAISGKIFKESTYEKTLDNSFKKDAKINIAAYLKSNPSIVKTKHQNLSIALGADNNDLKRNYEVALAVAEQTNLQILIRKHSFVDKIKNPEYLINGKYLGDRKSIESTSGILWQIDSSKKQMLHKSINPKKLPYYILFDLDSLKEIDITNIKRNIFRKITKERGTKIKSLLFFFKGKSVEITRETILNFDLSKLENLLNHKELSN